jgi:hypothetical protein
MPITAAAVPYLVLHITESHQRQHFINRSMNFTRTRTQMHALAPCRSPAAAAAGNALDGSNACGAAAAAAQLQQAVAAAAGAVWAVAVWQPQASGNLQVLKHLQCSSSSNNSVLTTSRHSNQHL